MRSRLSLSKEYSRGEINLIRDLCFAYETAVRNVICFVILMLSVFQFRTPEKFLSFSNPQAELGLMLVTAAFHRHAHAYLLHIYDDLIQKDPLKTKIGWHLL